MRVGSNDPISNVMTLSSLISLLTVCPLLSVPAGSEQVSLHLSIGGPACCTLRCSGCVAGCRAAAAAADDQRAEEGRPQ